MKILGLTIERSASKTAPQPSEERQASAGSVISPSRMSGASNAGADVNTQLRAFLDWVYAAVDYLAENVASVEFEGYVNRSKRRSYIVAQHIRRADVKQKMLS